MYQGQRNSFRYSVYQAIEGHGGKCSRLNLYEAFNATDSKEKKRIRDVAATLILAGYVTKDECGDYVINEDNNNTCRMQKELWNSIKIRKRFTVIDLCRDSDTKRVSARRYIRFLVKEGYVVESGYKTIDSGKKKTRFTEYRLLSENAPRYAPFFSRTAENFI